MKKIKVLFLVLFAVSSCGEKPSSSFDRQTLTVLNELADYYFEGQMDSVIVLGNRFLEKNPTNDAALHLLSSAHLAKEDDSLAYLYANLAIKYNGKNKVALTNLGILSDKRKEYANARKFYERALLQDSLFVPALTYYASNRLYEGDYLNAVKYGELVVEISNRIPDKVNLSIAYHFSEQYAKRDSMIVLLEGLQYDGLMELKKLTGYEE